MLAPAPMIPEDPADQARWKETGLRRRIMYGTHKKDIGDLARSQVGAERFDEGWGGSVDMSSNVAQNVYGKKAVQYDVRPEVSHPEGADDLIGKEGLLDVAGIWLKMPRVQRDAEALRTNFVRVDLVGGALAFRPVSPDRVTVICYNDRPGVPVRLREARLYQDPSLASARGPEWLWDELDLRDPANPTYRVLTAKGENVSAKYLRTADNADGDFTGDAYPYRYADGSPFIPYATYRPADAGMWDAYTQSAVFAGSLQAAVFQTQFAQQMQTSSFPQRYTVGVHLAGSTDDGNTIGVVVDSAVLLQFELDDDFVGQPQVSQFKPGSDVAPFQAAIGHYEHRVTSMADSPADFQRMDGDPRSGYALGISREARREAQKKHEEMYRRSDRDLVGMSAAILNRQTGTSFPESGYQFTYRALPQTPEELMSQSEYLDGEVEGGHMDKITAHIRRHPEMGRDQARADLERIATVNASFLTTPTPEAEDAPNG